MLDPQFSAVVEAYQQGGKIKDALKLYGVHQGDFYRAMKKDSELRDAYDAAKLARADINADEVVEIADTEPDPQRARVRIDARRWQASVWDPRRFGDKLALEVDAGPSLIPVIAARRARLGRDLDSVDAIKTIDITPLPALGATDKQTVAAPAPGIIDIFE